MEIDFRPVGSYMLCRPFALQIDETRLIDESDTTRKTLANVVQIVAKGPTCTVAEINDYAHLVPNARLAELRIKGQMYLMIQELQVYGFYKEMPDLSDIVVTESTPMPDVTEYVKTDSASQMKMNFETSVRD